MRHFFLTGIVVLQVAGLGYGLPHPASAVDDDSEDLSPGTWTQTTSATFKVITPAKGTQKPALVNHDPTAPEQDQSPWPEQGDLNHEITELRALRAHLAQLEKEVSAREEWLAAAVRGTGTTTTSSAIADCETLSCFLAALLRKTRDGLSAIFTHHDSLGDDGSDGSPTNASILLPPWRKPGNTTGDGGGGGDVPSQSPSPDDSSIEGPSFDILYPFAIFCAMFLVGSLLRRLISPVLSVRRRGSEWNGLVLPATEPHHPCPQQRHEPRRRWRPAWERFVKGLRQSWGRREGGIRLRESEVGSGHDYRDEKAAFRDDEGETCWEKYEGCMGEEEGREMEGDEPEPWSGEHPGEDGFRVFDGGEEYGFESDRDSHSSGASLDDLPSPHSSSETSSIGDEIASFRLAVELVERMFAAEERT